MAKEYYLTEDDRNALQETIEDVANNPSGRLLRRKGRNRNISGGFAVSGYDFETSESEGVVTIAPGNIVGGIYTNTTVESFVNLDLGTDGNHFIYIEIKWGFGFSSTWGYSFGVSITDRPEQEDESLDYPIFRKVLAKATVTDGAVSAFTPNHIGEIDVPRIA